MQNIVLGQAAGVSPPDTVYMLIFGSICSLSTRLRAVRGPCAVDAQKTAPTHPSKRVNVSCHSVWTGRCQNTCHELVKLTGGGAAVAMDVLRALLSCCGGGGQTKEDDIVR